MGNEIMQDYRGNGSFSRWIVLGCFVAAVALTMAVIRWPDAKDALLHAFDRFLQTGVWLFLGGKSPELADSISSKIGSFFGSKPDAQ